MSLLKDERGAWSAARVFLAVWLLQIGAYVWVALLSDRDPGNAVLTLDSGIALGLISWAAGARIAAYIGPQIGAASSAVGAALRRQILKRRESGEHEETR